MAPESTTRRASRPVEELHEIALVEYYLHIDDRAYEPHVDVGDSGARITFETLAFNSHSRGSVTATVANEIAATDAWGLATIHDPQETEEGVRSMLTALYIGQEVER